jgi:hypothetical protein
MGNSRAHCLITNQKTRAFAPGLESFEGTPSVAPREAVLFLNVTFYFAFFFVVFFADGFFFTAGAFAGLTICGFSGEVFGAGDTSGGFTSTRGVRFPPVLRLVKHSLQ